jgi:hypothetical protein
VRLRQDLRQYHGSEQREGAERDHPDSEGAHTKQVDTGCSAGQVPKR